MIRQTSYTLDQVYPALAIVEDQQPPVYEPVPLKDDDDPETAAPNAGSPVPVTTTVVGIYRLLKSVGGWTGQFRGLKTAMILHFCTGILSVAVASIPFVPYLVGSLVAQLLLVQLSTAWLHIVISSRENNVSLFRRLPPFAKAFKATALPIFLYWAATSATYEASRLVGYLLSLPMWSFDAPDKVPEMKESDLWKVGPVALVSLVMWAVVLVPVQVLLVRVQASLLPADEDTIVAFDRSFGGAVDPAIVSGKGYVDIKNAFNTFPRSSWIRIFFLRIKIFLLTLGLFAIFYGAVVSITLIGGFFLA
jgi:hypothetical protein